MDVFINDPTKILADNVVVYEMCDFGTILDQFKLMTSLDWSSLADNVVRQTLVLAIDLPESLNLMTQIEEAGKCATRAANDAAAVATSQAGEISDEAAKQAEDAGKKASDQADELEDDTKEVSKDDEKDTSTSKDGDKTEAEKEEAEENWWEFETFATDAEGKADENLEEGEKAVDETVDGVTDSIDGITDGAEGAANDALANAAGCVDLIDEFSVGKLGGKVFAKLFNNEVKPLNWAQKTIVWII